MSSHVPFEFIQLFVNLLEEKKQKYNTEEEDYRVRQGITVSLRNIYSNNNLVLVDYL